MLNKKKNNKGFTLVELLVVIAIIGILAVVAVPSLFKQIDKSKAGDITATIDSIKAAETAYYADNDVAVNIDTLVSEDYLDGEPGKDGKVTYNVTVDNTGKIATLTVTIADNYMSEGSLTKLGNDLGVDASSGTFEISLVK